MGGGRVQREIVPNSLYSLFFYFELFPKKKSKRRRITFSLNISFSNWDLGHFSSGSFCLQKKVLNINEYNFFKFLYVLAKASFVRMADSSSASCLAGLDRSRLHEDKLVITRMYLVMCPPLIVTI